MINDFRFLHYPSHIYMDDKGIPCMTNCCHKRILYKEEADYMIEYYSSLIKGLKKFTRTLDRKHISNERIGQFNDMYEKEYEEKRKREYVPKEKKKDNLYLAQNTETKHFKIGRSKNVASRLSTLNLSSPHNIELVFEIKGMGHIENRVHELFSNLRTNSEWFIGDDSILKFFKGLKEGGDLI